ncbi:MAG: hypothetical protein M3Q52_03980 [Pseudomonadota bacterium]|nr:hypothetical protein [Pseudomonadota bacterium]
MRIMPLPIIAATLASCSTAPQAPVYNARAEAELQKALIGKVAGAPLDCLQRSRTQDMIRIDGNTILFRDGRNRIYRNEINGVCDGLDRSSTALVTRNLGGGGQLCRGDIAQVVDTSTGMTVGSCSLGDFVPYTRS